MEEVIKVAEIETTIESHPTREAIDEMYKEMTENNPVWLWYKYDSEGGSQSADLSLRLSVSSDPAFEAIGWGMQLGAYGHDRPEAVAQLYGKLTELREELNALLDAAIDHLKPEVETSFPHQE